MSFVAIAVLAIVCLNVPAVSATKKPPLHPINLNTASALELRQVPGIGPATADKMFEDAQVVWPVQEGGRFARHQGNRLEAPGKNAQISDGGEECSAETCRSEPEQS
jgi:hypothetical protein